MELAVGMTEPIQEMGVLKALGEIDPSLISSFLKTREPRSLKAGVDELNARHGKGRMV